MLGEPLLPISHSHLFLTPYFLISSKWSLFFPPWDRVTVLTCDYTEFKLKHNHIYVVFTPPEALVRRGNFM